MVLAFCSQDDAQMWLKALSGGCAQFITGWVNVRASPLQLQRTIYQNHGGRQSQNINRQQSKEQSPTSKARKGDSFLLHFDTAYFRTTLCKPSLFPPRLSCGLCGQNHVHNRRASEQRYLTSKPKEEHAGSWEDCGFSNLLDPGLQTCIMLFIKRLGLELPTHSPFCDSGFEIVGFICCFFSKSEDLVLPLLSL